jgi:hypothetical protein
MFTNVNRPSAVDVLRPFAVGDTFYADTTTTLAKRTIGSTNDVLTVTGGVPVWSSSIVLTSLSVIDSGFSIIGSADATKKLMFEVDAQTANDTLTIGTGAQTDSRTLTVPVLTGNRTLAVIDQAQTFTTPQTIALGSVSTAESNLVLTATWNDAGDMFRALDVNVTDTASTATSKLIDLRIAGSSRFNVDKTGLMALVGGIDLSGTVQATIGPGLKITSTPSAFTGAGPEFGYSGVRGLMSCFDRTAVQYKGYDFNALDFAFLVSGTTAVSIGPSTVALSASFPLTVASTTDSTSKDTGSIITEGGLGVEKSVMIGGSYGVTTAGARYNFNVSGAYLSWIECDGSAGANYMRFGVANSEWMRITQSGVITTNCTTDSTSKDTGAIITEGGLGVEKSIFAGGMVGAGASTTSLPSLRLPHGTAPSSPTNGDMWTTTAGLFVRINGVTVGPLS